MATHVCTYTENFWEAMQTIASKEGELGIQRVRKTYFSLNIVLYSSTLSYAN